MMTQYRRNHNNEHTSTAKQLEEVWDLVDQLGDLSVKLRLKADEVIETLNLQAENNEGADPHA